ncbi:hypothetical protein JTE90_002973 [Oedothorax gibbosus]|uniref:Uncharacterized protein n=1 Tax=Oedothorax gibbosus TaxID=931172 RepID=A0AAV6VI68_9ARAC|nr:hypothetical protein JTE90_002973 [Oedothorax gibbosus]
MAFLNQKTPYIYIYPLLIIIPCIQAQCPNPSDISPCVCEGSGSVASLISCIGPIGLPKLTTILRTEMCGATIQKFEIVDSDIQHLPSNLFIKNVVKDIQISFTSISHFTRAGRSAFFGLERHLASLSMRRCRLVDSLQWQMIGELQVLTYLDLSYNNLTEVPKQWFMTPPPNLLSLIMKGNKISHLASGSLSRMYRLIELDLSENYLTTLGRDVFPYPGNALLFLRLNDNLLTFLPDDIFDEMLGLRRIYMDNNRLETLPQRVWTPIWGDLEHLNLDGNLVKCDCTLKWIGVLQSPKQLYGECYVNTNMVLSTNTVEFENDPWILPNNTKFKTHRVKLRDLEVEDFDLCKL